MKRLLWLCLPLLLISCTLLTYAVPETTPQANFSTTSPTPGPSQTPFFPITNTPGPQYTDTPEPSDTLTPTETISPTPTATKTKKPKATATLTPTWVFQDAGMVTAPILLYHHVVVGEPPNPYSVSLDAFKEQMQALHDAGYTTIPVTLLAEAIRSGATLPDRPVIITFDDGDDDVYKNAYPVMSRLKLTGTIYLVSNYLDNPTFMSSAEAAELVQAGWEAGSHSQSHPHFDEMHATLIDQVYHSRSILESSLDAPVETYAYPFGEMDYSILLEVKKKYTAAVGLGDSYTHTLSNIYYLSRIEISPTTTLDEFKALLPW